METNTFININQVRTLAMRYPQVVKEETEAVMRVIVARLEKDVVAETPRGVGGGAGLAGSIHGKVVTMAGASVQGAVGTAMPHGVVVEHGRRPGKGFPPVGALELWVRSKLGVDASQAKGVAYVVARKIARKGFKGAHMFEKAWEKNERWVMDQLQTIPGRVARRLEHGAG